MASPRGRRIGFPWSTMRMRGLLREIDLASYETEELRPLSAAEKATE
jgi:hypothetical protein